MNKSDRIYIPPARRNDLPRDLDAQAEHIVVISTLVCCLFAVICVAVFAYLMRR